MCSKGGVIEFYKLPVSYESLRALWTWNDACAGLASLSVATLHGPYDEWARKELSGKTSWVGRESNRLAKVLSKEIGRKIVAHGPPVHPFRL